MFVFYVDEAGCTGALQSRVSSIQPVFTLSGIILRQNCIPKLTIDFLRLKKKFFPKELPATVEFLSWAMFEVKGAELRKQIRHGNRDESRHTMKFMDELLKLFERYEIRTLGRLYVKGVGAPFDGIAVYASSVQSLANGFQRFLTANGSEGLMILDSRNKPMNTNVSHSIFTQKFKASGDAYDKLLEMPLFGHSDNHAGIQCADLLCSAFLFPMATFTYCHGAVENVHVSLKYHALRDQFGKRLQKLQYRYQDEQNRWRGGITVSDSISHQSAARLFGPHE